MRIGLIGVGNMGYPLLQKLLNKNYHLSVLLETGNTINDNCKKFYQNNLNNFIKENETIISILPKSNITLDIVKNINTNISKENINKYWIDLCTSCPREVKKINNILSNNNINYLESPVSGGPNGMKNGTLTSVVSGNKRTFEECHKLINLYSDNIYYVSENVGDSSKIKLANNTLLALNLISSAEVLNLLEKDNIDIKNALEFINNSSGRSWATIQRYPDNILTGKYDYGFSYDLHKKDVLTFLDNMEIKNDYLLKVIKDIYENKKNYLGKDMDHTEIVKLIK